MTLPAVETTTVGTVAPGAGGRNRQRPARTRFVTIALFVLPALVLFCLLVLVPVCFAIYMSFFKWNGFGGLPTDFVGLANFRKLIGDSVFLGDLKRGAILVGLSVVLQLPFAMAVALLLNQRLRGRSVFRLLFFAPYVLSEVITGVLFSLILSPDNQGLANRILSAIGLGSFITPWLGNTSVVLYTLFFVISWKYFGFHMILYLAGRQNIPNELTEAAAIDGGNTWQVFWHITLPLLGPTIRISAFLAVIGGIQLFDLPWVLTSGGPVHASETMAITMFQDGFTRSELGYGGAVSVAMFIICLIFALAYQRFVMRRDTEGAISTMRDQR